MSPVDVATPTFRHSSGDDSDGCVACWLDNDECGLDPENNLPCKEPTEDPDEPGVCWVCSHGVEAVT